MLGRKAEGLSTPATAIQHRNVKQFPMVYQADSSEFDRRKAF
jgi:hypothetical protein